MPAPFSAESLRLRSLLEDGPIDLDVAVASIASASHPGKSYREGLRIRRNYHKGKEVTDTRDKLISIGSNHLAQLAVHRAIKAGRAVLEERDGKSVVELGPAPWTVFTGNSYEPKYGSHADRPVSKPWSAYIKDAVQSSDIPYERLLNEAAAHVSDAEVQRYLRATNAKRTEAGVRRQIVRSALTVFIKTGRVKVIGFGDDRLVTIGDNPWSTD